jgi:hypothetical protein
VDILWGTHFTAFRVRSHEPDKSGSPRQAISYGDRYKFLIPAKRSCAAPSHAERPQQPPRSRISEGSTVPALPCKIRSAPESSVTPTTRIATSAAVGQTRAALDYARPPAVPIANRRCSRLPPLLHHDARATPPVGAPAGANTVVETARRTHRQPTMFAASAAPTPRRKRDAPRRSAGRREHGGRDREAYPPPTGDVRGFRRSYTTTQARRPPQERRQARTQWSRPRGAPIANRRCSRLPPLLHHDASATPPRRSAGRREHSGRNREAYPSPTGDVRGFRRSYTTTHARRPP